MKRAYCNFCGIAVFCVYQRVLLTACRATHTALASVTFVQPTTCLTPHITTARVSSIFTVIITTRFCVIAMFVTQQLEQHSVLHCVSKKFPPLNSLWLCQILTDFQILCTVGKRMEFVTKLMWHYPPHLRHVAVLPLEIKNANFLQIFCTCGRKCKQIAYYHVNLC